MIGALIALAIGGLAATVLDAIGGTAVAVVYGADTAEAPAEAPVPATDSGNKEYFQCL
jgi:hypothetical protein